MGPFTERQNVPKHPFTVTVSVLCSDTIRTQMRDKKMFRGYGRYQPLEHFLLGLDQRSDR